MATLNVSLPDNLKTYVTQRVHNGEYSNASDYIRTLIRKDREQTPLAVPDIPPQLLEDAARIQTLPLDTESKRRLLAMYVMLEKKRQAPAPSVESVIQGLQEMGEEAQRNGLTPEILDGILNG
jgi:antitoxin ParD1/3/4